jgi:FKBP-type peptidyl-prolyl cis-trans isomerase SlyD
MVPDCRRRPALPGDHRTLCDHSLMLITSPCVVSLTWTLADAQGATLDELTDPVEFFYGGDDLLAKLEDAIAGQEAGFSCDLHLEPEHAFGDYNPALVCFETREIFPAHIEEGMQFDGLPEGAVTPGHAAVADLHHHRDLPGACGAGRQPPAGRHGAAPGGAGEGVREATEDEIEAQSSARRRGQHPVTGAGVAAPPLTRFGAQPRPVDPKPPPPRCDAPKSSTTRKAACTTGTMTICAMRSSGCTVKAVLPRFQQLTISAPW